MGTSQTLNAATGPGAGIWGQKISKCTNSEDKSKEGAHCLGKRPQSLEGPAGLNRALDTLHVGY